MNSLKMEYTKIFNQPMEKQRNDYIEVDEYERQEERNSQSNGYYHREYTTRIGTLTLRVPRIRDGNFSPDIFERYQRNKQALISVIL